MARPVSAGSGTSPRWIAAFRTQPQRAGALAPALTHTFLVAGEVSGFEPATFGLRTEGQGPSMYASPDEPLREIQLSD